MEKKQEKFTIEELSAQTGMTVRTIRYYTQQQLVDRPCGTGKGSYYTETHREQLYTIKRWKKAGLSLDKIREILDDGKSSEDALPPPRRRQKGQVETWSKLFVADGVELHVEPRRALLTPGEVRELFESMLGMYDSLLAAKTRGRKQQ